MNASHKLCNELLCEYTDFKDFNKKEFVGYKLVERKGGPNYYSIVSGMFRYKSRHVSYSSYTALYEREKLHYNEHLKNRLAVFTTPEDAYNALCNYKDIADYKCNLVIIEITLRGNLEKAIYSNKYVKNLKVVVGDVMEKIREKKDFKHE